MKEVGIEPYVFIKKKKKFKSSKLSYKTFDKLFVLVSMILEFFFLVVDKIPNSVSKSKSIHQMAFQSLFENLGIFS